MEGLYPEETPEIMNSWSGTFRSFPFMEKVTLVVFTLISCASIFCYAKQTEIDEVFVKSRYNNITYANEEAISQVESIPINSIDNVYFFGSKTLLIQAIDSNNIEVIKCLIKRGADLNRKEPITLYTPLHHTASLNQNWYIAKLLLDGGANPNLKLRYGKTSLDICFLNHYVEDKRSQEVAAVIRYYGGELSPDYFLSPKLRSLLIEEVGENIDHLDAEIWLKMLDSIVCDILKSKPKGTQFLQKFAPVKEE